MKFSFSMHTAKYAILLLAGCSILQQSTAQSLNNSFWSDLSHKGIQLEGLKPSAFRSISINTQSLTEFLSDVPSEKFLNAKASKKIINLPMPNGTTQRFSIVEAPVMEEDLAKKYPMIKTYLGQGIDDPTATVRFDYTPLGFHAMILSVNGTVMIDPIAYESPICLSYYKEDLPQDETPRACTTASAESKELSTPTDVNTAKRTAGITSGEELRTYRLALAATAEYTKARGNTVQKALASMVTSVNRVVGVYEKEVAIRFTLISNTDKLIYTDAVTDPYTNDNGSVMLGQNQTTIDNVIGTANYDIGHVFSTGGGGVADLQSPCNSSRKARGVTGSNNPTGDPFDIDFVAHEIGHQFGGQHTFNSNSGGSCAGNRASISAYEPGSGITIMGYAGICGPTNNLAANSIPYFHSRSFDEIKNFSTGTGDACAVTTTTGNHPPDVDAGADYTIPKSTPFILTGKVTDEDGDAVTYSWEEYDLGPAADLGNSAETSAPIFRPFPPVSVPYRIFPQISDIRNNKTTRGEILPSVARTLNFRLTGRDNRAGGGGVAYDNMKITVNGGSGPLVVTYPNTATTWAVNQVRTVTWDVANTNIAPVSCTAVNILLSKDGGTTFTDTLLKNTPNDGSADVIVPNILTTQARIIVQSVNNIFFAMSRPNFTIATTSTVKGNVLEQAISVYPNPTQGDFSVSIDDRYTGALSLQVLDVLGRLIQSKEIEKNQLGMQVNFDLNDERSGIYFVKISNASGEQTIKRILKN